MKTFIVLSLPLLSLFGGIIGCAESDKSSIKQETQITTPKGTTTITTEKEVKKTGEAP